jgi:hypothetical protein
MKQLDVLGPVLGELAHGWEPSTARLVPIGSG